MNLHRAFADKLDQRAKARTPTELADEEMPPESALPCILVVDDEPEITRSVARMLDQHFRVLTANSAQEGLELLARNSVAVILTDQRMPGGTGVELLSRSLNVAPETTRILFTGYSDISAVVDAVNEGHVYRYITKPWRPEELQGIISQGVDRYELMAENRRLLAELKQSNAELEQRVAERTQRLQDQNRALSEARRNIELLSRKDGLTGLTNRRWLDETLHSEAERSRRDHSPFSVVMADLDHFKEINDRFGHSTGDQVLRATAQTLQDAARMTDIVGRYGGEEFLILMPNSELEQAEVLAEEMRVGIRDLDVTFRPESVTASFGVAQMLFEENAANLIDRADDALYSAKRDGRDRVVPSRPNRRRRENDD